MVYIYGARAGNPEKARENPAFQESRTGQTSFSQAAARPSLSSCSAVRRRPVQFYRLSRLVLLFVAVQFSSAVSLVLFCCSSPSSSVRPSLVLFACRMSIRERASSNSKRRTTISLTCTFDKDSAVTIHIFMYIIEL